MFGNRGRGGAQGGYRMPQAPKPARPTKAAPGSLGWVPGAGAKAAAPKGGLGSGGAGAAGWGRLGGFSKGGKVPAVKKGGKPGKKPGK
jgi:hypothetical protein